MIGTFIHPQPASRQRAVPELSVTMPARVRVEELVLTQQSVPKSAHIEFDVRYRFDEYLGFILPFAAGLLARQRRAKGKPYRRMRRIEKLMIACCAWPIFRYKLWRVGDCHFRIDAQGIARTARTGRLFKPWAEIVVIKRFGRGWLVGGEKGAMPLPLRCMSQTESARLAGWIAQRRAAPGASLR